jgi:hypothetical protein
MMMKLRKIQDLVANNMDNGVRRKKTRSIFDMGDNQEDNEFETGFMNLVSQMTQMSLNMSWFTVSMVDSRKRMSLPWLQ